MCLQSFIPFELLYLLELKLQPNQILKFQTLFLFELLNILVPAFFFFKSQTFSLPVLSSLSFILEPFIFFSSGIHTPLEDMSYNSSFVPQSLFSHKFTITNWPLTITGHCPNRLSTCSHVELKALRKQLILKYF